jgi:hypothetical protein
MSSLKFYAVTGRGFFPTDMLRYDSAEPMNTAEAGRMAQRVYEPGDPETWAEQRDRVEDITTICLVSNQKGAPCVERWASFGWIVTDVLFNEEGYRGMYPGEHLK